MRALCFRSLNPSSPPRIVAGGCYNFTGHSQPDVQYKANAVKTSAKGYRSIWFRNGNTTIDIAYPAYYMRGATAGPLIPSLVGAVSCCRWCTPLLCEDQSAPGSTRSSFAFQMIRVRKQVDDVGRATPMTLGAGTLRLRLLCEQSMEVLSDQLLRGRRPRGVRRQC